MGRITKHKRLLSRVRKAIKTVAVRLFECLVIAIVPAIHRRRLSAISTKPKLTVVFIVIHGSVWKYDGLYQLLAKDTRYDPVIVICPFTTQGESVMFREMSFAEKIFSKKGYQVSSAYDSRNKTWIDIKRVLKPDIVFFTNPHNMTLKPYLINNFLDVLTCYCQYSFHVTHLNKMQYDQFFHNVLWKAFYETPSHEAYAIQYSRNKARNVVVTGFPGVDRLVDRRYVPTDPWKVAVNRVKRVIWAPHHSIDENKKRLSLSTFLRYAEEFLDLAEVYKDKIQFAFKPHPLLRGKLEENEAWGIEKTRLYYEAWQELPNGQLEEGFYDDLFLTSDALILDSASFMSEYLCTGKPSLFLMNDPDVTERFNSFGIDVFNELYHGQSMADVYRYIEDVVIGGTDPMQPYRIEFVKSNLIGSDKYCASERIKIVLDSYFILNGWSNANGKLE